MKRPKKYRKSRKQLEKQRVRRRKLREIVLNMLERNEYPTQQELAERLGCSQATVYSDLQKLGRSRWNPFRIIELQFLREIEEYKRKQRGEWERWLENLTPGEKIQRYINLTRLLCGGRGYPQNSKPRAKPFSKTYQPHLGLWGDYPFQCTKCGYRGEITVKGSWRRGETLYFDCPNCREKLEIIRPKLSIEKRSFKVPCGHDFVVETQGRWDAMRRLSFDCSFCGRTHIIEKRFTKRVPA